MVTATSPGALTVNPYDYSFHKDPYPLYQRLRGEAPLCHQDVLNVPDEVMHRDEGVNDIPPSAAGLSLMV